MEINMNAITTYFFMQQVRLITIAVFTPMSRNMRRENYVKPWIKIG